MFYLLKKSLKGLPAGARTGNALISRSAQDMPSCKPAIQNNRQGYSLVELLIVVAIIATIAAIAIPSYSEMVNTAYVVAAIGDIKKIQYDIEWYYVRNGSFPESLAAAKIEERLDPWGVPYQYLKIAGAQKKNGNDNGNGSGGGTGDGGGKGKGGGGGGSGGGSGSGGGNEGGNDNVAGARKDKNLHPLNSDFDLYSKGRDRDSKLPLTAEASRDDIIRANNGGFIGLAKNY
jgi:general secretion pathway protein G